MINSGSKLCMKLRLLIELLAVGVQLSLAAVEAAAVRMDTVHCHFAWWRFMNSG